MPVAYDAEKIISELEAYSFEDHENHYDYRIGHDGRLIDLDDAIDVIKEGLGINDAE